MKTLNLKDIPSLTETEHKVLKDMFGEIIPVSTNKHAETLVKAILSDIQKENEVEA